MSKNEGKTNESKNEENRDTALLSDILPLRGPRFTYADSEADVISMPMPPAGCSITECLIMRSDPWWTLTSLYAEPNHEGAF